MNFRYLRHPILITALVLTALNDHIFKQMWPSFLTGKISDFTGLFYFPFFLYALVQFIKAPHTRHQHIEIKKFIYFILITDFLFIIFKFTFMRSWIMQNLSFYFFKLKIVSDPTDLWAISVNLLSFQLAQKFTKTS